MIKKRADMLLLVLIAGLLFGLTLLRIGTEPLQYSYAERRTLAQRPQPSAEKLLSGQYMKEYEAYTLDQFPMRDELRKLKARFSVFLLQQKDHNGYYVRNGSLSKLEYPQNDRKLEQSLQKLQEIQETYLSGTGCKLYLSLIPDKNYYLAPQGGYPVMDYAAVRRCFQDGLPDASYIDIWDQLSSDAYYRTDPHWRQERIFPVAQRLAQAMGVELSDAFTEQHLASPFYGAYYGQAALPASPDTLYYRTSELLSSCKVTSYNTGAPLPAAIYDMDKALGRDPYEMFLSGSDAFLVIENPENTTGKELVLFRDSFASSLTPLLVSGYSKITLIDLRYLRSDLLRTFLTFDHQDVLFLYSTLVLNHTISI